MPIEDVRVDPGTAPVDPIGAGAGAVVHGSVRPGQGVLAPGATGLPYGGLGTGGDGEAAASLDLPLVPYHRWAERGPSTMRVWIPTT